MKNKKILAGIFAVMALVSGAAHAESNNLNFDGRGGSGFTALQDIQASIAGKSGQEGFQTPVPAAVPVQAARQGEVKVKILIKSAGKTKEEILTCQPGLGADKIADCKKTDGTALEYKDINTLGLRTYFSAETLKFADLLNQAKHSYTNQSGPMTFSCEDWCAEEETIEVDLGTLIPNITVYSKCTRWSHQCECTAGC